jgi:DNA-binding winged helix-turn-helix (wHTH) protein
VRDGTRVTFTPEDSLRGLTGLVERHGTIVEEDALLRFVWPNAVVEENKLSARAGAVHVLRLVGRV